MVHLYILAAASCIAAASAACTRDALSSTFDSFMKASLAKSASKTLSLAPTIRISQNNVLLPSIEASTYTNITSYYKPWKIQVIDSEICTIATFLLANQKNDILGTTEPAMMSFRMQTSADGKTIEELEILNVLKGSHAFFSPASFPDDAPAIWSTPTKGNLSREKLIEITNLYPSGIQLGDGSAIPGAPSCPRVENGVKTTDTCYTNLKMFKQPVRDRRFVADTLTGVVLGAFYFDKPVAFGKNFGLWLNEYFKIDEGRMAGIQAAMKEIYGVPFVDVWGSKK